MPAPEPRKNPKTGHWEMRFTLPKNKRGESRRAFATSALYPRNRKEDCRTDAEAKRAQHMSDAPTSKLTFQEFFEQIYMPEKPASKNLTTSSVANLRYRIGQIACPVIGKIPIGSVDGGVVARLQARLRDQTRLDGAVAKEEGRRALQSEGQLPGIAAATIDHALRYLGYVLEWAKSREPTVDPATRLQAAVEQFFTARSDLAPSSTLVYRSLLRRHVVPHIGNLPIGKVNDTVRRQLRETLATAPRYAAVYVEGALKKDGSLKKPWEVARDKRRGSKATSPDAKRYSPWTIKHVVTGITAVLRWAHERKHIAEIPKIELPKVPQTTLPPPYSRQEAQRLIAAAADDQRRVMYVLSFDTGCRKSELLGLEWEQIDWERHQIFFDRQLCRGEHRQTKGGKARSLDMTAPLETALKKLKLQHGAKSSYVFCQEDGRPFAEHHLRTFEERDAEKAGLRKVRWHNKRHTFANLVSEGGATPWSLQIMLGHASITTTQGYVHASQAKILSVLDTPVEMKGSSR